MNAATPSISTVNDKSEGFVRMVLVIDSRYGQGKAESDQCENLETDKQSTNRHSYNAKRGLKQTSVHEWSTPKVDCHDIPSRAKLKKIVTEGVNQAQPSTFKHPSI